MASETVCDIIQEYITTNKQLPQHPLEALCVPINTSELTSSDSSAKILHLMEVYIDIGLVQALSKSQLVQFIQLVLHGIHTVFPPPGLDDDLSDEPIALKKSKQGDGMWSTKKELLGWLFDGISQSMQLPSDKVTKITQLLKDALCCQQVWFGDIKKIDGKLMHASIGIPNGRRLLLPLMAQFSKKPKTRHYKDHSTKLFHKACQAMKDWIMLLPVALQQPTSCNDLVPVPVDYGGYCDAS